MKFNINKYLGNYAMHCKTEEEAKIFLRYLDSVGRKWVDGTSYMSMTNWSVHGPDTCYDFYDGTYCNKTYFLTCYGYTVLEFSDFEWDYKSTKRKPVIIYRNGQDVIALDKETGEKAVAKCHPNDEFDFAIGAKIAFGRLYHSQDYISEDNKAKCKPEFQVGDRFIDDRGCFEEEYYDSKEDELCEKFDYEPCICESTVKSGKYTQEEYERNCKNGEKLDAYLEDVAERAFQKAIILYIGVPNYENFDEEIL